jgi:putative ABC transport system substrate-binding protein
MQRRRALLWAFLSPGLSPGIVHARDDRSKRIVALLGTDEWPANSPDRALFTEELKRLGWDETRNLAILARHNGLDDKRLDRLAQELVAIPADVIVALGAPATRSAMKASTAVPIVLYGSGDPVGAGFVASLARPGGNVTGNAFPFDELEVKELDLLIQALGAPKAVAYVTPRPRAAPRTIAQLAKLREAANARKVELKIVDARGKGLDVALADLAQAGVAGAVIDINALDDLDPSDLAAIARRHRMPAIMSFRFFADAGIAFSYGVNDLDLARRCAGFVAKILAGAKPKDLPVESPNRFEFVINIRTTDELGLKLPPAVLLQADDIIR